MQEEQLQALMQSDDYQRIARRRRNMTSLLALINVGLYVIYVLCMGYAREFMGQSVGNGSVTIGLLFVIFLIVFAALISGFYIWWSNRYYTPDFKKLMQNYEAQS